MPWRNRVLSAKYTDDESGLLYFGYRYYQPSNGRWEGREPIEERGGSNLACFVSNNPQNYFDVLGLYGNPVSGPTAPIGPGSPNPFAPNPVFSGPWQMLSYLFFGNLNQIGTLSQSLITLIMNNQAYAAEKSILLTKIKQSASCGIMGLYITPLIDNTFTLQQASPSAVNMGFWQLKIVPSCLWQCGGQANKPCCCLCNVNCTLQVTISKTWTFAPGFNPANSMWPVQLGNWIAGITQGQPNPGYFISGAFSDNLNAPFTHCP